MYFSLKSVVFRKEHELCCTGMQLPKSCSRLLSQCLSSAAVQIFFNMLDISSLGPRSNLTGGFKNRSNIQFCFLCCLFHETKLHKLKRRSSLLWLCFWTGSFDFPSCFSYFNWKSQPILVSCFAFEMHVYQSFPRAPGLDRVFNISSWLLS